MNKVRHTNVNWKDRRLLCRPFLFVEVRGDGCVVLEVSIGMFTLERSAGGWIQIAVIGRALEKRLRVTPDANGFTIFLSLWERRGKSLAVVQT